MESASGLIIHGNHRKNAYTPFEKHLAPENDDFALAYHSVLAYRETIDECGSRRPISSDYTSPVHGRDSNLYSNFLLRLSSEAKAMASTPFSRGYRKYRQHPEAQTRSEHYYANNERIKDNREFAFQNVSSDTETEQVNQASTISVSTSKRQKSVPDFESLRNDSVPLEANSEVRKRKFRYYPKSNLSKDWLVNEHPLAHLSNQDQFRYTESSKALLHLKEYVEQMRKRTTSHKTANSASPDALPGENRGNARVRASSRASSDSSSTTSSLHSTTATVSGKICLKKAHACLKKKLAREGYSESYIAHEIAGRMTVSQAKSQRWKRYRQRLRNRRRHQSCFLQDVRQRETEPLPHSRGFQHAFQHPHAPTKSPFSQPSHSTASGKALQKPQMKQSRYIYLLPSQKPPTESSFSLKQRRHHSNYAASSNLSSGHARSSMSFCDKKHLERKNKRLKLYPNKSAAQSTYLLTGLHAKTQVASEPVSWNGLPRNGSKFENGHARSLAVVPVSSEKSSKKHQYRHGNFLSLSSAVPFNSRKSGGLESRQTLKFQREITKQLVRLQKFRDRGELNWDEFEQAKHFIFFSKIFDVNEQGKIVLRKNLTPSMLKQSPFALRAALQKRNKALQCDSNDESTANYLESLNDFNDNFLQSNSSTDHTVSEYKHVKLEDSYSYLSSPFLLKADSWRGVRGADGLFYIEQQPCIQPEKLNDSEQCEDVALNVSQKDHSLTCRLRLEKRQEQRLFQLLYQNQVERERMYQRKLQNYKRRATLMRQFDQRAPPEVRMFQQCTTLYEVTPKQLQYWESWYDALHKLPVWMDRTLVQKHGFFSSAKQYDDSLLY